MVFGFGAFVGACAIDMAVNGKCTMSYPELGVGMAACIIGSLAPDIDHPNSKISTSDVALGALSTAVCSVTSHRRHTHTLLFCILGGIGAYLLALLTIGHANTSTAFLMALATFILLQIDETTSMSKFASIIAVGVYFGWPLLLKYVPIINVPAVTIPTKFAKYIGIFFGIGCLSHLVADAACKEGVPLLWPILPMNKHFRFAHLTTGTIAETIVASVFGVIFTGAFFLLFKQGYYQLPF